MQKQILAIGMIAIAASIGFTAISNNVVFAQGYPQLAPPNNFGQQASQFPPGGMGQHASDPEGNGPQYNSQNEHGRTGIGNFGHPADVAFCLTHPSDPRCQ